MRFFKNYKKKIKRYPLTRQDDMLLRGHATGHAGPMGVNEGTARSGPGPNMAPVTLNVNTSSNAQILSVYKSFAGASDGMVTYSPVLCKNTIMLGDLVFRLVVNGVAVSGVFSDFSNLPVPISVLKKGQVDTLNGKLDCNEWLYDNLQFVGVAKEPKTQTDGGLAMGATNGLVPNTGTTTVYINGTTKILANSRNGIQPGKWLIYVLPDFVDGSSTTKYTRNVARIEPVPDDVFSRLMKSSRFCAFDRHYYGFLIKNNNAFQSPQAISKNPFTMSGPISADPFSFMNKTGVDVGVIGIADKHRAAVARKKSGFYDAATKAALAKGFALIHALCSQGVLTVKTVLEKKNAALAEYVKKSYSSPNLANTIKVCVTDLNDPRRQEENARVDSKTYVVKENAGFEAKDHDMNLETFISKSKKKANLSAFVSLLNGVKFVPNDPLSFLTTARGMHAYMCMGNMHEDDLNDIFGYGAESSKYASAGDDASMVSNFISLLRGCDENVSQEFFALMRALQSRVVAHSVYSSPGNKSNKTLIDDNEDNPQVFVSLTGTSSL